MSKKISYKVADRLFSAWIRARDKRCVRCGRASGLHCSHFWPRGISATRYDPENCDALCYACHYGNNRGWERAKQGEYRDFKISQLGQDGYATLRIRAGSTVPRNRAVKAAFRWLLTV